MAEEPHTACGPGLLARGLFAPEPVPEAAEVTADLVSLAGAESARRAPDPGRRGRCRTSPRPFRGRGVRVTAASPPARDMAWAATLLEAAFRRRAPGSRLALGPDDLRRWVRSHRPGRLLLFVVDASGSMGADLVAIARGLALGLLKDAYVQRDRVALVAFRERTAELVLAPTDRPERVHRVLSDLALGGTTPLGPALALARRTLERGQARFDGGEVLVVVSDGRGNVGEAPGRAAVVAEIERHARALGARAGLVPLLLDATEEGGDERPARRLADALGATRVELWRAGGDGAVEQARRLLAGRGRARST